jgi:hypothetical protein
MATKNDYTRERRRLNKEDLKRARSMVAGSRVPGRGLEWADTEERGLALRVLPLGATWYLRMRTTTVRLGTVDELTVQAARAAASKVKLAVKEGRSYKADLAMYYGWTTRKATSRPPPAPRSTTWTCPMTRSTGSGTGRGTGATSSRPSLPGRRRSIPRAGRRSTAGT